MTAAARQYMGVAAGIMAVKKINLNALRKRGIESNEDMCYVLPYKFYNASQCSLPCPELDGKFVAINGVFTGVRNGSSNRKSVTTCYVDVSTPTGVVTVRVVYYANASMKYKLACFVGRRVIVYGKLEYSKEYKVSYSMMNPLSFHEENHSPRWVTVYPKIRGISDENLRDTSERCRHGVDIKETIPRDILKETCLPGRWESLLDISNPRTTETLVRAIQRQVFEDLLYFACCMAKTSRSKSRGSQFNAKTVKTANAIIKSLDFELTNDQKKVFETLTDMMKDGRRVSHLIQGDVSCGKSIVAFLLMSVMADSGYQSVIMAPTLILAKQHYDDLKELMEPYGYRVAFLNSELKQSEQKKIKKEIEAGGYQMIVGTHSVISDTVKFANLGMVIIDEEQRFGVKQRQMLREKASGGVHSISMSATPIARSIAESIYGNTNILEIKEMPKNRKRVKTAVSGNREITKSFVKRKVEEGGQAYVICPLITKGKADVHTVEEVAAEYAQLLGDGNVGMVTGKMDKAESAAIIEKFRSGELKVIVGTTVLEVGVSVKAANVIVIEDAWMYGLSQLHQLRGRVGRSTEQGYCVLLSDRNVERLSIMSETTDGFKIAEEDLRMRGPGDLMGEEQTGRNRFISEVCRYPNMFKKAAEYAEKMVDDGSADKIIDIMESRGDKAFVDVRKITIVDTVTNGGGVEFSLWNGCAQSDGHNT